FLKKAWDACHRHLNNGSFGESESLTVSRARHRLICDVSDRMEYFKFNTVVSAFMEFINTVSQQEKGVSRETVRDFLILLSPFAPHFACELWERMKFPGLVFDSDWPRHDPQYLVQEAIRIGVQVKGKLRGSIKIAPGATQEEALKIALADSTIKKHVGDGPLRKVIYVKGRILNLIN
ncbi:MAG: class I tRNA ligase family protein, partial [Candidatus Aminicenantes bacterium]|nr:class I tRNA ligase family protein [Candidatus Aminicenantes bacterium]